MKNFFIVFLCLAALLSCEKIKKHNRGFYYWRTELSLNHVEKSALKDSELPILYTRFFDVDKIGGKFQPIGVATNDSSFQPEKAIVPVVFIMNRVFYGIKSEEISFLAKSINDLVDKKTTDFQFNKSSELQIDCDWTAGTKADYFEFLKKLQKISGKNITCTLRLHQVQDRLKTGIPPVQKVYLMCYSTSSPLENSDKNSILDVDLAKNYLANLQNYPIKNMDVALPIYSWGIVTNHFGKKKLINALTAKDLSSKNLRKIAEQEAEVLQDGFYFGNYMSKGFTIKIEEVSDNDLDEITAFLDKKLTKYNVIYYQLDRKFVENRKFFKHQ